MEEEDICQMIRNDSTMHNAADYYYYYNSGGHAEEVEQVLVWWVDTEEESADGVFPISLQWLVDDYILVIIILLQHIIIILHVVGKRMLYQLSDRKREQVW